MGDSFILYLLLIFAAVSCVVTLILLSRMGTLQGRLERLEKQGSAGEALVSRQDLLIDAVQHTMDGIRSDLTSANLQTDQKLDFMRRGLESALTQIRRENLTQIQEIRTTVDEKLQDMLEKKLSDSFAQVSQQLEQVYKGLGEMQTLASGVGDLKRVLSNVKTRGILGEIQLGAILEQMLSPEQYATNVAVKKGSAANVEFAIKLPGGNDGPVWLPIDSKFPLDAYEKLLDAQEKVDMPAVDQASKELRARIRGFAKDIHDKYIAPPETTDFAIMFLPSEGLYAEAVRIGMIEQLQREFKVSIAGPTTMGALLNSLQMGFRTLAIQKRSGEVWQVLSAVKTEFDTFGTVLEATQKRILQANDELDKLVGVRTRKIQNTLRNVQTLSDESQDPRLEDYINHV
ncbi:MAG: DNA recombination protein RmuC [Clostridia bacterium]|nr:DNA recombination protein RmuC [Clostridia bacterium]MBQ3091681.1 DNA recombination protein RmuC [Clostridia bacterium]